MLDQEAFFKKYKVEKEFRDSGLEWRTLEAIYDDYCSRAEEVEKCKRELEQYIRENMTAQIHSLRCRSKDPNHLIEKIIRKRGKEQSKKYADISVSNYREVIRDLIGVRILVLSKEEWESVFDDMIKLFPQTKKEGTYMEEPPIAYTRYGDRNIFKGKIKTEHTNKGYRSQHYIIKFQGYYCEIQTRSLAEEVFGEVDHKVKYPYREGNRFLKRYTNTLSQLLESVDELISTCFQMNEEGWEYCNSYYEEDEYIDWKNISQAATVNKSEKKRQSSEGIPGKIEISSYANNIMLRKGYQHAERE